jgi:hypothetical protein
MTRGEYEKNYTPKPGPELRVRRDDGSLESLSYEEARDRKLITPKQYERRFGGLTEQASRTMNAGASHRAAVARALSEGKPVPAEVLADYPDLGGTTRTSINENATDQGLAQTPNASLEPDQRDGGRDGGAENVPKFPGTIKATMPSREETVRVVQAFFRIRHEQRGKLSVLPEYSKPTNAMRNERGIERPATTASRQPIVKKSANITSARWKTMNAADPNR